MAKYNSYREAARKRKLVREGIMEQRERTTLRTKNRASKPIGVWVHKHSQFWTFGLVLAGWYSTQRAAENAVNFMKKRNYFDYNAIYIVGPNKPKDLSSHDRWPEKWGRPRLHSPFHHVYSPQRHVYAIPYLDFS